jgi:hypothetical protein
MSSELGQFSKDVDIFETKYDITKFELYPVGKEDQEDYKIDMRGMYGSCELFENFFSPFLEFHVTALDSLALFKNLPLRGGELLRVKFKIVSEIITEERTLAFRLVSWNKITVKDNMELYTPMIFMSKQYFYNLTSRINWAYPKETELTEIVKNLCEKVLHIKDEKKEFDGHPSNKLGNSDANQFTFTNNPPLDCIMRLIPFTAHKEDNKLCDFLFYESLEKDDKIKFNFKSLNKIVKDAQEKWTFLWFPIQNSKDEDAIKMISEFREKKIVPVRRFKIKESKNTINGIENSLAGGAVHTVNPLLKSFRRSEIDVTNLHKKCTRLNDKAWYIKEDDKHFFTQPTEDERAQQALQHFNIFKTINGNIFNNDVRDVNSDLLRKFNLNVLNQYQILLECAGNTDIHIGWKTKFKIEDASISKENEVDKSYDSDLIFLITAIKHTFDGKDYMMTIELSSDGEKTHDIYSRYSSDKQEWVKKVGKQLAGEDDNAIPGVIPNDNNNS